MMNIYDNKAVRCLKSCIHCLLVNPRSFFYDNNNNNNNNTDKNTEPSQCCVCYESLSNKYYDEIEKIPVLRRLRNKEYFYDRWFMTDSTLVKKYIKKRYRNEIEWVDVGLSIDVDDDLGCSHISRPSPNICSKCVKLCIKKKEETDRYFLLSNYYEFVCPLCRKLTHFHR